MTPPVSHDIVLQEWCIQYTTTCPHSRQSISELSWADNEVNFSKLESNCSQPPPELGLGLNHCNVPDPDPDQVNKQQIHKLCSSWDQIGWRQLCVLVSSSWSAIMTAYVTKTSSYTRLPLRSLYSRLNNQQYVHKLKIPLNEDIAPAWRPR